MLFKFKNIICQLSSKIDLPISGTENFLALRSVVLHYLDYLFWGLGWGVILKKMMMKTLTLSDPCPFHLFPFSALVWGASVKHNPQKVGKEHTLEDEDVIQLVKK